MSDAVTTARNAREALARGLSALQSDPNVPQQLLDLAAPIAQSMGALHQIERSGGTALVPHAEVALNNVRTALGQLQSQPTSHPSIIAAMEAVASSLGLVHALAKMAQQAPQAQPAPQAAFAATQAQPQQVQQAQYAAPPQQPAFPQQQQQQQQGPTAFQRPSQEAFHQPQQQPSFHQQPAQPRASAQPPQQAYAPPQQQQPPQRQAPPQQQAPQGTVPVGDLPVINADLGAHSPTNFYKGLSGNDIIDHGGLFVSTYRIPKIGTPVRLKVALPGGYEFEANAVVRWSREQSDEGNDAPPGFGAQFTEITNEARQLVYRYVRNREPLFHDDL